MLSAILCARFASYHGKKIRTHQSVAEKHTAAARSTWPGAVAGLATTPGRAGAAGGGRGAAGIGGLPGPFAGATVGLAPGAGGGFGLPATGGGGGFGAKELEGREFIGVSTEGVGAFFQGVADPLAVPIPGKTETGFAEASAVVADAVGALGVADGTGRVLGGGGGGGGAGAALGGTSSR